DYCEPGSIETLVASVLERTGGQLDALFNNGAYAQPGAVEDLPVAALREQFEANVFGWHDLTRRVVPVMRRQGHGRLVHCSYEAQLQRLQAGGSTSRLKPGPEVVHAALRHALLSRRPHPHYVVTVPARIGVVLKRILPASMLYRLLAKRA
ncbi:MAG: SDR family oxidoreductase, partial [Mesorhizobium sp.]